MRRFLRKLGHDSTYTNAVCWQPHKAQLDSCISELHFCRDFLTLETIVHEATHAALHRVHMIGVPDTHKDWQEYICEDAGTITEGIIAFLHTKKVPIKYKHIPTRRLI